jgi:hypothetical protein
MQGPPPSDLACPLDRSCRGRLPGAQSHDDVVDLSPHIIVVPGDGGMTIAGHLGTNLPGDPASQLVRPHGEGQDGVGFGIRAAFSCALHQPRLDAGGDARRA